MSATLPAIPPSLARKLTSLRRRVYLWLAFDGLGFVGLSLVGLVLLSVAVDWYFHLDRIQRAVCLFLGVAAVVLVVLRRVVRPLLRPVDDDALCLRVEAAHRELGQGLLAATQFPRYTDAAAIGVSPALVAAAIEQGTRAAEPVDFADALGPAFRRRTRRRGAAAALALGLLALGFLPADGALRLWFHRDILLGNAPWPQQTHLYLDNVTDGTLAMPRGDDFDQFVRAEGAIPSAVYLDIAPSNAAEFGQEMVQIGATQSGSGGGAGGGGEVGEPLSPRTKRASFRGLYRNVLEPFAFRVRGGDAETAWVPVRLVDRPRIEELVLTYTPPAYTKVAPYALPAGEGLHEVLTGGALTLRGRTNKPLAQAELVLGDRVLAALELAAPDGAAAFGALAFTGKIDPEHLVSGSFGINLLDTDRLASKRPTRFALKIVPDRKPVVRATLQGVTGMVTTRARVPVNTKITDDYGIASAGLVYRRANDAGDKTAPQTLPFTSVADQLGKRSVACVYPFEIAPLNLPVGTQLSFQIEARDFDDVSGPNVGASPTFYLKVVNDDELRAELLRREQEQRQEFERLLKDQEELLTDARATLLALRGKAQMTEEQRQLLIRAEKRQRLARDRGEAIADQFATIYLEVQNNRLEDENGPVQRRLQNSIIQPLRELGKDLVPRAADALDAARKAATDAAGRDQALEAATAAQRQIVDRMREMLRHMVKWEGYQEAVNLLHEILKAQNDVSDATTQEMERRIREIFGGGGR